jgi:hypothetical protein
VKTQLQLINIIIIIIIIIIYGASVNRAILQHCFFWFGDTGADAAIAIFSQL